MNENEKAIVAGAVECLLAISIANESNEAVNISKAIDFIVESLDNLVK